LQVEFAPDQKRYNNFLRLAPPQHVEGFVVELPKNYSGQEVALRDTRQEDVYRLEKCEGLERCFWCQLHLDFYMTIVLKGSEASIPCKYVDWPYFEKLNDPHYNATMEICKEFGLYDLMGFRYNWNTKILAPFLSSLYYDAHRVTFYWTTEGEKYGIDYMTFSRLLGLGSKDEKHNPIHVEQVLRSHQVPELFFNPMLANKGNASTLLPCYYGLNRFFRNTVDAKKGDGTTLHHYAVNLLARTLPGGRPFCIMDYM